MTHIDDRLVTLPEAACLFGYSRRTLYRWVENGHLTPVMEIPGPGRAGTVRHYWLSEVAEVAARRHAAKRDNHHTSDPCDTIDPKPTHPENREAGPS